MKMCLPDPDATKCAYLKFHVVYLKCACMLTSIQMFLADNLQDDFDCGRTINVRGPKVPHGNGNMLSITKVKLN